MPLAKAQQQGCTMAIDITLVRCREMRLSLVGAMRMQSPPTQHPSGMTPGTQLSGPTEQQQISD
jgi:hypothetical protein